MIAEQDVRPWSGSSGRRSAGATSAAAAISSQVVGPKPRSANSRSATAITRALVSAFLRSRSDMQASYRLKWQLHAFDSHCHYAYFGGHALSPHSPSHRPRHRGVGRRLRDRPLLLGRRRAGPRRGRVHRLHRRPRPGRRRRRLRLPRPGAAAVASSCSRASAPPRCCSASWSASAAGSPTARSTATAPPASSSRRTSCSAACSTRNSPARPHHSRE